MRINNVTDRFAKLENRSGCYMRSKWNQETQTQELRYRYGSNNLIAEIYEYKNSENYRVRIHPRPERTGRTEHNNRVCAVLVSIQKSNGGSWDFVRYSTHIRYSLKVWDRKLMAEYDLMDKPMEFSFTDGKLTLDYQVLERNAFPSATPPTPVVELDTNSNLQNATSKLTAILAGV